MGPRPRFRFRRPATRRRPGADPSAALVLVGRRRPQPHHDLREPTASPGRRPASRTISRLVAISVTWVSGHVASPPAVASSSNSRQRLAASQPVQPGVGVGAQDRQRSAIRRTVGLQGSPRELPADRHRSTVRQHTRGDSRPRHKECPVHQNNSARYAGVVAAHVRHCTRFRVASATGTDASARGNVIRDVVATEHFSEARERDPDWDGPTPGGPFPPPGHRFAVAYRVRTESCPRRTRRIATTSDSPVGAAVRSPTPSPCSRPRPTSR